MKITVIGGGPGGLYFSILTKKTMPDCTVDVYERNKADDAFGFGVVFSDETLSEFLTRDPRSYDLIRSSFAYWDDLDVVRNGEKVRISGNGFCGCSRKTLLQLLQQRCREEGVNLHFETNIDDLSAFADSHAIVACDGINSFIREQHKDDFGTNTVLQRNKFVWLGSTKPLDAFAYFFRTTPYGTFVAHTYQYQHGMSTWIFECTPETWEKAGFETTDEQGTIEKLSQLFAQELDGHPLISNRSHWRQFPTVTNRRWHHGNIVLLGDAKATAHYSIGSGTKLAMECAIALSDSIVECREDVAAAFERYEEKRRKRVEMIQHAAAVSLDWFEHMDRHIKQPFLQFAFGVMTRAKKVTLENLSLRDKSFTDKVLSAFNLSHNQNSKTPPAFTPLTLRDITLANRIAMAPMEQCAAQNGLITDWHLVHYGGRATGGIGLIFTEPVAVADEGRITLGCPMIKTDEQAAAWDHVVSFVHRYSKSKIAIQLGHAGRKSGVKTPLAPLSASPVAFSPEFQTPEEMTAADMDKVVSQFVAAARNADRAGFDMIEIQMHHGFLLASFLSPLTNLRTDIFGGSLENRLRLPMHVFNEVRKNFSPGKPISIHLSATDWADGGTTQHDAIAIAQAFKDAGADVINVSTGQTVANEKPQRGRMWQTPFSDAIRNTANIPTITSGAIQDIDQINTVILNGRADVVALGRPLLLDPGFVRHAQAYEQFSDDLPQPYHAGITHLYPLKAAERKEKESMKKALKPESHKKI
jgi:anthraniloyl-CoA monooxygenase